MIKRLLSREDLNKKITNLHKFLEISMMTFSSIDEPIVKQINLSKKSGQKKTKTIWRKLTSFLE